jgi:competence protein ComEC
MSPKIAIAATTTPDIETIRLLEKHQVHVYYTGRDGAIQWSPATGFKPYLEGDRDR